MSDLIFKNPTIHCVSFNEKIKARNGGNKGRRFQTNDKRVCGSNFLLSFSLAYLFTPIKREDDREDVEESSESRPRSGRRKNA